jgi:CheY-like chemotaxis protein
VVVLLDGDLSDVDSDLDGAACCRALAAMDRLAGVPIVLMVTKGDDVEERLARAPNVVDYITKPFSPEAVAAVVTQVVQTRRSGSSAATVEAERERALARSIDERPVAPMTPPGEVRPPFEEMRAEAARRIEAYRQETDKWDLTELVQGAFDDAALESLVSTFLARRRRATRPGTESDVLSGELSAITVSEVLSWLQDKSQTGRLQIVQPGTPGGFPDPPATDSARQASLRPRGDADKHVEIYVRRGKVDFAAAAGIGEDLLLGRFAVEAGALTPDALTAVLDERARATTKPGLFGVDLVARGLITEAQLKQAMARQISEVIYETLRWTQGQFAFRSLPAESFPALARDAALGISVDGLLLEGFRRVDEWRVIEREIGDFDLVFVPNESRIAEVARGQLTRDEIAVLELVNGKTPVKDIIRALRLGSFDVSKILFRLLRAKLIRRRVAPTVA